LRSCGGYSGGGAAIGYANERNSKVLTTVDANKTGAVIRAFELRAEGFKLQQIADRLNAEGYTTKQGARSAPTQVMRILKRKELYSGIYTYSGISASGKHEAII